MKFEMVESVDVPVDVIFNENITVNARLVYIALKFFINRGIQPTNRDLAGLLKIDKRTIIRNLLVLEEAGVIDRKYDMSSIDRRTSVVLL